MPKSNADDFPPYGPVPYEIRKPLVHRDPPQVERRSLPARPMLSPPVLSRDHRLLQSKSTGQENKALKNNSPPAASIGVSRPKLPSFEDIKQQIDEEEANRLNWMDGYTGAPPRPREGFGLQLRPQHDAGDINEYFTGPKWHDPNIRPFVESAERGLTPRLGPWIERKPKPKVLYREEGEAVQRAEPPPPPPPPSTPPPKVFTAKNIRFKLYSLLDCMQDNPAEFDGPESLEEVRHVGKILQEHPNQHVQIRASAGLEGPAKLFGPDCQNKAMDKRGEAVSEELEKMGIERARIQIKRGKVGTGTEDRKVEFEFFEP